MGNLGLDLSALPEDCIENVLSLTSPRDTCRFSVMSSLFRSVAKSDAVWQKYLPSDYRSIIDRSTDPSMLIRFSSLKDLYFSLCDNPILVDNTKFRLLQMGSRGLDLSALPEDCIENVLSLSGPRDTCRLSVISSLFRSAAESDAVWQKYLPPDYRSVISRSTDPSMLTRFSSLKDLYFSLCDNPILIDDAKLSFSLEKSTGKKCYMLSARNLVIIWGDTPRYWKWTSEPECRFGEVAELIQVCWLEIRGKLSASLLSRATFYSAYLVFKLTTRTYGFDERPLDVSMGHVGAESPTRSVYLVAGREQRQRYQSGRRRIGLVRRMFMSGMRMQAPGPVVESDGPYPRERKDGWFEIELGEFFNKEGEEGEIEMTVFETDDFNWKRGLIVQGIEIRPKEGK